MHVDVTERCLIKSMVKPGVTWQKVQPITGRTPDTTSRIVDSATSKKKGGTPSKNSSWAPSFVGEEGSC